MTATKTSFDFSETARSPVARKLTLTVLAGGPGGEREVSLESGRSVAAALESLGHDVQLADIGPDDLGALARNVDCIFVALHGRFGEDGELQKILERRGLVYCGSGPEACALAMNKAAAKQRFQELGLPTPLYEVARQDTIRQAVAAWSMPVVVKPVQEGSSLDCSIQHEAAALRSTVEALCDKHGECLVEEYIPGKELTVSILGEQALTPLEIRTKREFYDYQAKYVDDNTEYDFEIDLPADLLARIGEMSLEAHRGLGCRDFSRVDWRVDAQTFQPYLLEVNVIPGLTGHSLLPKAAARAGLAMPALCQLIIEAAMKRGAGPRL